MNIDSVSISLDSLSISLRIGRLVLSALLAAAVTTEVTLSIFWQLVLAGLAVYTFITGVNGRDPLFAMLRDANSQMSGQVLDLVARFECLSIGLICIVAGIMNHHVDSLIFRALPFLGVYSILLCAVKYDLLDYLLESYRKDLTK